MRRRVTGGQQSLDLLLICCFSGKSSIVVERTWPKFLEKGNLRVREKWQVKEASKGQWTLILKRFDENWDVIFGGKNQKHKQQNMTELNADGNRERGRSGEDLDAKRE